MSARADHIVGQTYHGRKGSIENAFRYSVDYILVDAEAEVETPHLFARNARAITSLHDTDHGGPPKQGRGAAWVREVLEEYQIQGVSRIDLLAQPRVFGHVFNPVSFWLCRRADEALIAVISEVTNTYGDRHSYLCHHSDLSEITRSDQLHATKIMYVSPFQPVEGDYTFRFDVTDTRVGVWIDYGRATGGLIATLTGKRQPLSNAGIMRSLLRRPFGARRVLALIHWQALKLWVKGAVFRSRPVPPTDEITKG
jgi:DUF1365 family protein